MTTNCAYMYQTRELTPLNDCYRYEGTVTSGISQGYWCDGFKLELRTFSNIYCNGSYNVELDAGYGQCQNVDPSDDSLSTPYCNCGGVVEECSIIKTSRYECGDDISDTVYSSGESSVIDVCFSSLSGSWKLSCNTEGTGTQKIYYDTSHDCSGSGSVAASPTSQNNEYHCIGNHVTATQCTPSLFPSNSVDAASILIFIVIGIVAILLVMIFVIVIRNKPQQSITEYDVALTVEKNSNDDISNIGYVTLSDNQQKDQLIHQIHNYRAKYGPIGRTVSWISLLFCIAWIAYIISTFISYGITSGYCTDGKIACHNCDFCIDGECYSLIDIYDDTCYDGSVSMAPFFGKISLLSLNLYFVHLLLRVIIHGVEIYNEIKAEEEDIKVVNPSFIRKILMVKQYLESKRIDLRKWAYKNVDNDPTSTSIQFLQRSFIFMQLFKLIEDSPNIILNCVSGNPTLLMVGIQVFVTDILNILNTLYWNFGCPCFRCAGCSCKCSCNCHFQCCCSHFPKHHVQYVMVTGRMMQFVCFLQFLSGLQQIFAVANVDVSDEFHLWLLYLNFLSGVKGIIDTMKLYWLYYYQLCFYWSRNDVNNYENHVILDMISGFFVGGYIFQVSVDKETDKFIRVNRNQQVMTKINHEWNWFACYLYLYFFLVAPFIGAILIYFSSKLNG
eukprot:403027_1